MSIHPVTPAAPPGVTTIPAAEVLARFRAVLVARDIVPPDLIIADGQLHRCNAAGARGRGDADYCCTWTAYRSAAWRTGETDSAGRHGAWTSAAR